MLKIVAEAQVIKNHTSQTSIACRALMAKHRWAISGTPVCLMDSFLSSDT